MSFLRYSDGKKSNDWESFLEYCLVDDFKSSNKIKNHLSFKTSFLPSRSTDESSVHCTDPLQFGMKVIYPFSSKLCSKNLYYDQSLITFIVKGKNTFTNLFKTPIDPSDIICILIFERSKSFQGYRIGRLSVCPHFTLLTIDLPEFLQEASKFFDEGVEVIFVPRTCPYFRHPHFEAMIVNSDHESEVADKVLTATTAMFEAGVGKYYNLQDQGRGDVHGKNELEAVSNDGSTVAIALTNNDRHIPTLTLGYSNMDAKKYKLNRYTILGHTKPFINDSGLPHELKKTYLLAIKQCFKSVVAKGAFHLKNLSSEETILRKKLIQDFYLSLGGDADINHSWFCNESNSDVIVDRLAPHCDKQNSSTNGLDTALVFSCHPPMSSLLTNRGEGKARNKFDLHKYLCDRGYTDTFPSTRVHYCKGINDGYLAKKVALMKLSKTNMLYELLIWGLTETMKTHFDYRGSVFDNDDFLDRFESDAKVYNDPSKLLKGKVLRVTAAFDKIGYNSIFLEGWNILSLNFLSAVTALNAIEYSFYTTVTCNGTALLSRILYEIHEDKDNCRIQYKRMANLFKFLCTIDKRISKKQEIANPDQVIRSVGNCTPCRSQTSALAMSTDYSGYFLDLLMVINVAFWGGGSELLDEDWKVVSESKKGYNLLTSFICSLPGINTFLCHNLTTALTSLGLVPIQYYDKAVFGKTWSDKSGPVKLAAAAIDDKKKKRCKPVEVYCEMRDDVNEVFGRNDVTLNYIDNFTCESWRTYTAKLHCMKMKVNEVKNHDLSIIMDKKKPGKSSKEDIYYWIPQKDAVQNVFLLSNQYKSFTSASPGFIMRSSLSWKKSSILFTDWHGRNTKNGNLKNLMYWDRESSTTEFDSTTTLVVTDELRNHYFPVKTATKVSPTSPARRTKRKQTQSKSTSKYPVSASSYINDVRKEDTVNAKDDSFFLDDSD